MNGELGRAVILCASAFEKGNDMQWVLHQIEDNQKLADVLDRMGIAYSMHKVVPFVGDLVPEPEVTDPHDVVLFGSYALRHFAQARGYLPGVFTIEPFLEQTVWHPYLLNGPEARVMAFGQVTEMLEEGETLWFFRPVDDSKAVAGGVKSADEIIAMAARVNALPEGDIPVGSLRSDTQVMLTEPAVIRQEWRVWIVAGQVVTSSLYKDGARVVYRAEIDDDARAFAQEMADANPGYSDAYVMDVCRTGDGLRLLETNCINAAGFYAADLGALVAAVESLTPARGSETAQAR